MSESFEKAVEASTLALLGRPILSATTVRAALHAALPHLTAEDVPHLIRQAKAEAWEVGYAQAQYTHCEAKWQPCDAIDINPYAEETT